VGRFGITLLALNAVFVWVMSDFAGAQPKAGGAPAEEEEFYKIVSFDIPEEIVLEVGAIEVTPDGRLAVATRRGDVYLVSNALEEPGSKKKPRFSLWASGMHEVLGLAQRDGWLYAVQRGEVTRLKDVDGDGRADVFETFCDDWGISGDYHEYPIGSTFDAQGNLYVTLCLTGSFTSEAPFRGWCMKITPDGKAVPFASGIRSPGGVGFNAAGDLFYTDNQGPWNGTSSLKHLVAGAFVGHPVGNKWYDSAKEIGPRPKEPKSGSRFHLEAQKIKEYVPPACLLPHQKVGQSASGIACDLSGGKFGTFAGQLFVGDQHHSNLTRVVLEKVNDRYQGVAIPFRSGFASGIVPVIQAPDGSLFAGSTNRGWGSVGPKEFALERLVWTGRTPFELLDMKARPDGFELIFTQPVDKATAADLKSYTIETFTYIFQAEYGSPEVDRTKPTLRAVTVSDDGLRARLTVDGCQVGHIHELKLPGVRSASGRALLHPVAWYTLWNVPKMTPRRQASDR
jgi:glucose/arabinose dehydrogenase